MNNQENIILVLTYAWLFICAFIALVLGIKFFFKKSALYMKLITYAMACFSMAYLFELLQFLITGKIVTGFEIGILGQIGGIAFLFSASFGQMDGLVDDHSKSFTKYRLMALVAPFLVIAIIVPVLISSVTLQAKLVMLMQSIFVAGAIYYNFKHIIIVDVELGIIRSIRGYNIVAVILQLLFILERMAINLLNNLYIEIFAFALGITFIMLIIILKKGVTKWTI